MPGTPKRRPVFDDTVGVDWSACPLVERVDGRVSGVPTLRDSRLPADSIVSNFDVMGVSLMPVIAHKGTSRAP